MTQDESYRNNLSNSHKIITTSNASGFTAGGLFALLLTKSSFSKDINDILYYFTPLVTIISAEFTGWIKYKYNHYMYEKHCKEACKALQKKLNDLKSEQEKSYCPERFKIIEEINSALTNIDRAEIQFYIENIKKLAKN